MARVLIVDDDAEMCLLLTAVIENLGHATIVAGDVSAGLAALDSGDDETAANVDLVVCDVEMPGLDGLRFLSLLRDEGHDVPVIMTSGRDSIDVAVECLRRGAVAFVEKPLDVTRLQREVTVALERGRDQHDPTVARPLLFSQPASINDDADRTVSSAVLPELRPLTKIGRFEVDAIIGRGGFGVVYRCFDPALMRQLAVKVIPRSDVVDGATTPEADRAWRRFVAEAQAAGGLIHPHIATVYDFGFDGIQQAWFMAMELVQGTPLVQRLQEGVKLDVDDAVVITFQLADALAYAHKQGVVHRDVKPANIMLVGPRFAKLLDFGLARRGGGERLTEHGTFLGTPSYTAPERFDAFAGDARSDQFSLGVVAHEMLSGRSAFGGDSFAETMKNVLHREPYPLSGVPASVTRIVEKMLEKDPSGRFQGEDELLAAWVAAGAELGLSLRRS